MTVPAVGMFLLYRYSGPVAEFWRGLGTWGPVVFAVMAIPLGAALLPTWVTAVLAGFLFGVVGGTVAADGAIVLGALLGYGLGRVVAADRARQLVREHPKWQTVEEALLESGFWKTLGVITLVRLPSTPYSLTNLVMAALRAKIVPFLLGTFLGTLPRTILWTFVGRGLEGFSSKDLEKASTQPRWVFAVTIALAVLGVVAIGHVAQRALARVAGAGEEAKRGGGAEEQRERGEA
jgi:uncharacterized membrane protein YdjX (TVP38/TMEM64 family)